MTNQPQPALHKHPRGNDLVLSIVLEGASQTVRVVSPQTEGTGGEIIQETRATIIDPASVQNLSVRLYRTGCGHIVQTPAHRVEGGAIILEVPAEVQQIGTYSVEVSYDIPAPQLSDGLMRITTDAPAVQIVQAGTAPHAQEVTIQAHVLPVLKGLDGKDGGGGLTEKQLMDLNEAITKDITDITEQMSTLSEYATYTQNLAAQGAHGFFTPFHEGAGSADEGVVERAERLATYAHWLKGMVDALNQFPPIENVDPEALTPGKQLLYLKNDIEQLKGLLESTREELQDLKAQAGGNQGGVSREDFEKLKDKTDKLESMISNTRGYGYELHFNNEDDVKDLSQGERDLIEASLKRAILAPWLADEEVWGKWWVYDRTSSIKKLATPTEEFKAGKGWGDGSGYRFQAVNNGTLVGNFYTLEQAMASITYPAGDLRIYVYGSSTPHAIFDPIPSDAYKVSGGHIALDSGYGTATLSIVEGDYELIKDTPDFQL